jgi:hypothetical protein
MLREITCATAIALSLVACGKTPESMGDQSTDRSIATAESFVDAFYSYDPGVLRSALSSAEGSAAPILFYQGWAEGGNYEVVERMPCKLGDKVTINCSITVKDDLIGALGIESNVTDTFHLTFSNDQIVSVTTSSNDPQEYYDAEDWVKENRPELIGDPCKQSSDRPSTPGDCVRGMVRGYSEFVEAGGLSEKSSTSE